MGKPHPIELRERVVAHVEEGRSHRSAAARMAQKSDLTLDDLVAERAEHHGITIHRVSVWRFLRSLGLTHEKSPPRR